MPNPNCPECKGTGKYHGLNEISDCKTCKPDFSIKESAPIQGYVSAGPNGRNAIPDPPPATSNDFDDFLMNKTEVNRFANRYAVEFYKTLNDVLRVPGSTVRLPISRRPFVSVYSDPSLYK